MPRILVIDDDRTVLYLVREAFKTTDVEVATAATAEDGLALLDYKAVVREASQDVTVLVRVESGTSKELVSRAIYHHSQRAKEPFLAVNCAAIPDTLLESDLFGHEKGAFTGADRMRIGKFEQCSG